MYRNIGNQMSELYFWDVQYGHSTTVLSSDGQVYVVDLGQGSYGSGSPFSPLLHLYARGIQKIDHLIISHPHLDHIDDILNVERFDIDKITTPAHLDYRDVMTGIREADREKFERYWDLQQQSNGPIGYWDTMMSQMQETSSSLHVHTFVPRSCGRSNLNNHSVVTVFEQAGIKIVVPGDNEACSFEELLQDCAFRVFVADAAVLLAPHHGRMAGTHREFLDLVNPKLCVISDGRATETSAVSTYSGQHGECTSSAATGDLSGDA